VALAFGAAACLAPLTARAQSPAEERAVQLGHEALALFEAGDCPNATPRFEEANRLVHSPVFLLHVARCRRKAGLLLAARDDYQRIVAEVLPDTAPEPWRKARADAAAELAALEAHIPALSIVVRAPRLDDVTVRIDGEVVPLTALGRPVPLNPGVHKVSAERPGEPRIDREIQLAEDRVEAIELAFGGPVAAPTSGATPVPAPALAKKEGSLVPGLVVLGVAGVALGVGGVAGAVAKLDERSVLANCSGNICLLHDQGTANTAVMLANVSTGGFVAAGVLAAAGVVLVIVRPGRSSTTSIGLSRQSISLRVVF
jgi:hypothetical protein